MDNKITLSFNETIINKAKRYAEKNNIRLSRLVEFLLLKATSSGYQSLEDFPIFDWVTQVAEGETIYQTSKQRTRKSSKEAYYKLRK